MAAAWLEVFLLMLYLMFNLLMLYLCLFVRNKLSLSHVFKPNTYSARPTTLV